MKVEDRRSFLVNHKKAQVDSLADFPYDPKRVFKVDRLLLQLMWGFITYLPLFAVYGYYRGFVLGKRYRQIVMFVLLMF